MIDPTALWIAAISGAALLAWIVWPRQGVLAYWKRLRQGAQRVLAEDALKHAYDCEYRKIPCTLQSAAGALSISTDTAARLITGLQEMGLIQAKSGGLELTPDGRTYALRVIRVHRLWERYLADETSVPQTDWHSVAERVEHRLNESAAEALSRRMGNPRFDPHGDPIPTASGEMPRSDGVPLPALAKGEVARIIHVEDEPNVIYAQLAAMGVHPGMQIRLLESTAELVRFELDGELCVLAPLLASNVSVVPLRAEEQKQTSFEKLSSLSPGEEARVRSISWACRGQQRRRLMDLGIVPGTKIRAELKSLTGDPVGYRIRGTTVALRRQQSDLIYVQKEGAETR